MEIIHLKTKTLKLLSGILLAQGLNYVPNGDDLVEKHLDVENLSVQHTIKRKVEDNHSKYFVLDHVPSLDESVHREVTKFLTREDISPRKDQDGNLYGNLFARHPELTDFILHMSEKFEINPYFLTAVIMQESGNGTSNSLYERNNTSGMRCISDEANKNVKATYKEFGEVGCIEIDGYGDYAVFSSIKDSIAYTAWTLRENYFNQGLTTLQEVGEVYAPYDDIEDPENLNKDWIPNIRLRLKQFSVKE